MNEIESENAIEEEGLLMRFAQSRKSGIGYHELSRMSC